MGVPPRRAVVATAVVAVGVMVATWLAVRGSMPASGGRPLPDDAWPWSVLRWGALASEALAVASAVGALARLRGRWGRWPPVVGAGWLLPAVVCATATEIGRSDVLPAALVGAYVLLALASGILLVPLGGVLILGYGGFLLTPPRPPASPERFVLAASAFWAATVLPAACGLVWIGLSAFEGFD